MLPLIVSYMATLRHATMKIFNFHNTYLTLPDTFYSYVKPAAFKKPELVILNKELLSAINIDDYDTETVLGVLSGRYLHEDSKPYAQAYAGHQFGHFTMLGDGRAIMLGEHLTNENKRYDIQLKGAGRTPYSRGGDGKAALKAMLREYLMSEAMHHLNVASSRSLAVIKTGENVYRETPQEGAVLTRLMKSHIRIGTFEYASYYGGKSDLEALLHYTIKRLYPHIRGQEKPALSLLEEVMHTQINLVTHWMRVGFIHGVMNTDNISLSGETFDYGPCAFMNTYHPQTVFSSIDADGRYAFENQSTILRWNLVKFAEALLPLIDSNTDNAIAQAQEIINKFDALWDNRYYTMMLDKLGIENKTVEDRPLVDELLEIMKRLKLDYTNSFTALSFEIESLNESFTQEPFLKNWLGKWHKRIALNSNGFETAKAIMKTHNPVFIPRNHRVEDALSKAEKGDLNLFNLLQEVMRNPYAYDNGFEDYINAPDDYFDSRYQTFCGT